MYQPNQSRTTSRLSDIPDGKNGTRETLKRMRVLARDGKTTVRVRELALSLVANLPAKDWRAEVEAVHNYVRDEVRYVRDIDGVETIATTNKILDYMQGDCDDKAILAAALLGSIGHPSRFVAVGFNGSPYSHVFVQSRVGAKWITLETTQDWPLGRTPPGITSRLIVGMR